MRARRRPASLAQASVETLLVFVIFLSAFGIVYAASSRLASAAQLRLGTSLSQASFSEFSAQLRSACMLGSGNARTVEVKGAPATLSLLPGGSLNFTSGSFFAQANSSCPISLPAALPPSRAFRIENKDGTLEIS